MDELEAIEAELSEKCKTCGGIGWWRDRNYSNAGFWCNWCGGSGLAKTFEDTMIFVSSGQPIPIRCDQTAPWLQMKRRELRRLKMQKLMSYIPYVLFAVVAVIVLWAGWFTVAIFAAANEGVECVGPAPRHPTLHEQLFTICGGRAMLRVKHVQFGSTGD